MIKLRPLLPKIDETVYNGMVGIHELSLFYDHADLNTQLEVDELFETGNDEAAWDTVNNFLRTIGKLSFAENITSSDDSINLKSLISKNIAEEVSKLEKSVGI